MTLHLIGIGLHDQKDITVRGLDLVKAADLVFLEAYTSILGVPPDDLEQFYGKAITLADRTVIEKEADRILEAAKSKQVAVLVIGDVFSATTHMDLYLRAKEKKVPVTVTHNASVLNAVGLVGLELYKYGKTTSIPFQEDSHQSDSFLDVIEKNRSLGYHTLLLLDLRPQDHRFMTIKDALDILLEKSARRDTPVITEQTPAIGCARLGGEAKIRFGTVARLRKEDFGDPLHCIVIPGDLHFLEEDALKQWRA